MGFFEGKPPMINVAPPTAAAALPTTGGGGGRRPARRRIERVAVWGALSGAMRPVSPSGERPKGCDIVVRPEAACAARRILKGEPVPRRSVKADGGPCRLTLRPCLEQDIQRWATFGQAPEHHRREEGPEHSAEQAGCASGGAVGRMGCYEPTHFRAFDLAARAKTSHARAAEPSPPGWSNAVISATLDAARSSSRGKRLGAQWPEGPTSTPGSAEPRPEPPGAP